MASYKPSMLVTGVRFPVCASYFPERAPDSELHTRGIEPRSQAWEACMMPLHYVCDGDALPIRLNSFADQWPPSCKNLHMFIFGGSTSSGTPASCVTVCTHRESSPGHKHVCRTPSRSSQGEHDLIDLITPMLWSRRSWDSHPRWGPPSA